MLVGRSGPLQHLRAAERGVMAPAQQLPASAMENAVDSFRAMVAERYPRLARTYGYTTKGTTDGQRL
jgi:hypothetical protein